MQDRRGRDHGLAGPDLGSSTAIPDRPRPTTPNPSVAPIQFRHSHDKPVRDLERQLLCGRLNLARNESRLGPVIECAVRQPKFTATPIAVFVASKLPSPPGKTDPATFKVSLVCDSWWSCCCRYRTTCADNSLSPCPVEAPENRRSRRRSRVILRVQVPVVGPENARAKPRWRSNRLSSSQRRRRPSERSVPKARTPKTRATDSHPDPGVPRGSPDPSDGLNLRVDRDRIGLRTGIRLKDRKACRLRAMGNPGQGPPRTARCLAGIERPHRGFRTDTR